MKKIVTILVLLLIFVAMLYYLSTLSLVNNNQPAQNQNTNEVVENKDFSDALNTFYYVDGREIMLKDGYYEAIIDPVSGAKLVVRAFGAVTTGDISHDDQDDLVLMLSYDPGGSGTFYYAAAAINKDGFYYGTNAILLGDRIAPQNINIENKIIVANYADREPGDSMIDEPSQGKSKYIKYENDQLLEANVKDDLIIVDFPIPNSQISSPLTFSGKARGPWFFEASFPVYLVNWDGLIIAQGIATAQGDWMTNDYVPFSGTLEFEKPDYGERGAIIFQKDNPSGLSEYDNALEMSIRF